MLKISYYNEVNEFELMCIIHTRILLHVLYVMYTTKNNCCFILSLFSIFSGSGSSKTKPKEELGDNMVTEQSTTDHNNHTVKLSTPITATAQTTSKLFIVMDRLSSLCFDSIRCTCISGRFNFSLLKFEYMICLTISRQLVVNHCYFSLFRIFFL